MKSKTCKRILESIAILAISGIIFTVLHFISSDNSSYVSSIAIIIAIILFYGGWRINRMNHEDNQISLVDSLMSELEIIENHLDWYLASPGVPGHEVRMLQLSKYIFELDQEVNGKSTNTLKDNLNHLNDKIQLINNYASWAIKLHLEKPSDDRISVFFNGIKKIVPEARESLRKCRSECNKIK